MDRFSAMCAERIGDGTDSPDDGPDSPRFGTDENASTDVNRRNDTGNFTSKVADGFREKIESLRAAPIAIVPPAGRVLAPPISAPPISAPVASAPPAMDYAGCIPLELSDRIHKRLAFLEEHYRTSTDCEKKCKESRSELAETYQKLEDSEKRFKEAQSQFDSRLEAAGASNDRLVREVESNDKIITNLETRIKELEVETEQRDTEAREVIENLVASLREQAAQLERSGAQLKTYETYLDAAAEHLNRALDEKECLYNRLEQVGGGGRARLAVTTECEIYINTDDDGVSIPTVNHELLKSATAHLNRAVNERDRAITDLRTAHKDLGRLKEEMADREERMAIQDQTLEDIKLEHSKTCKAYEELVMLSGMEKPRKGVKVQPQVLEEPSAPSTHRRREDRELIDALVSFILRIYHRVTGRELPKQRASTIEQINGIILTVEELGTIHGPS
eukprot:GHVO01023551.1.p1 GENE.GHVO01023551.1~~GHVO01023551.1.p1  ORF type:complete len:449 (+),score=78.55 GHVO01023551.1:79-1425(+)